VTDCCEVERSILTIINEDVMLCYASRNTAATRVCMFVYDCWKLHCYNVGGMNVSTVRVYGVVRD